MLLMEDVTVSRGDRDLMSDVQWRLLPGERVGLVGPNGAVRIYVACTSVLQHDAACCSVPPSLFRSVCASQHQSGCMSTLGTR